MAQRKHRNTRTRRQRGGGLGDIWNTLVSFVTGKPNTSMNTAPGPSNANSAGPTAGANTARPAVPAAPAGANTARPAVPPAPGATTQPPSSMGGGKRRSRTKRNRKHCKTSRKH